MPAVQPKPKLVYLVSEDWYFVSHRLPLALAARDHGYAVTVIARVAKHADVIRDHGLTLVPLAIDRSGTNPFADTAMALKVARHYRTLKPDVVHHVAMKPVLYGSLAARAARVPGVVNALMGLGYVFSSQAAKAKALRPFVRTALRSALSWSNNRTIVQNHDDYQLLLDENLAPRDRIALIRGSGVDLEAFPFSEMPSGRPRVVLPARLLRDKGIVEFVEAARILKAEGLDAEFVLAGSPDPVNPSSLTEAEIASYVRDGLVTCLGWRSDMAEVYRHATLVCLPSYREGLPKALLEAAAVGRAIVATDVPGCREIVHENANGWLVPPRDAKLLAAAIRDALSDPDRLARFALAGRARVERDHAEAHIFAATLKLYEVLLAAHRAPSGNRS